MVLYSYQREALVWLSPHQLLLDSETSSSGESCEMRWVSKLLALAATGALGTNASETSIFTFPSGKQGSRNGISEQQTVPEDVARLVLELRMKSSLASVLGHMDTDAVDSLNQFADAETTLFGGPSDHEIPGRSLIFLEGLDQGIGMWTGTCRLSDWLIMLSWVARTGSNMRKTQPHSLTVPQTSSDLVGDSLESLMERDNQGTHCIYLKGADGAVSNTAQVSRSHLDYLGDLFIDDVVLVRQGVSLKSPGSFARTWLV